MIANGTYKVWQVKAGIAYDGWLLVITAWPDADGRFLTEAMALPLDLGGSFFRVLHRYSDVSIDFVIEQHKLTGINIIDMNRRGGSRGDEDRPLQAIPLLDEELHRHWISALTQPADNPFRELYRSGVLQLAAQTQCPALREDMNPNPAIDSVGLCPV
jgi:hypothetical protein